MNRRTLARIVVALLIAAMLGGASLIIARNDSGVEGAGGGAPSGFLH